MLINEAIVDILVAQYPDMSIHLNQFQDEVDAVMVESEGGNVRSASIPDQAFVKEAVSVYVRNTKHRACIDTAESIYRFLLTNLGSGNCITSVMTLNTPYLYSRTDNNEYIFNLRLQYTYKQ